MTTDPAVGKARALLAAGRTRDALAILTAHVASAPDDAEAWCLIAQGHIAADDWRTAEQASSSAIRLEPESEWAHRLHGIALLHQGYFTPARRSADEAVRLAPWSWQGHHLRANVDIDASSIDDRTYDAVRRTLELAPNEPAAHVLNGRLALAMKNTKLADHEFREALRLDPDNAIARNNLAVVQIRRRRWGSAGSHLIAALRLDPHSELLARNLRGLLRAWALVLDLLVFVGAWILLSATSGHTVSDGTIQVGGGIYNVPSVGNLTLPGGLVVTGLAGGQYQLPDLSYPTTHHVAASGHPGAVTGIAAAVALLFLAAVITIRRSLGRNAWTILRSALRADRMLLLTVATATTGVLLLVAAAALGMPLARVLVIISLVYSVVAGLVVRLRRRRSTPAPDLR